MHTEKFMDDFKDETFRQNLLRATSAQRIHLDESKRPAYKTTTESFRKLAID